MNRTVSRRMGPQGSPVWHAILDGAEHVLREEGYGALTSRRVAECAGVKQRLIYYYFQTMDDLVVELFRRLSERDLDRLEKAIAASLPLREIWETCVDNSDTRMTSEFMALANRIDALRTEVTAYIEKSRALLSQVLHERTGNAADNQNLPAIAAVFFATSAAIALHREEALGITTGHDEVMGAIDYILGMDSSQPR